MLAPRIKQLAIDALELERMNARQSEMLDHAFDMYSELYDWAADTADTEASQTVLTILEKHLKKFKTDVHVPSGVAPATP